MQAFARTPEEPAGYVFLTPGYAYRGNLRAATERYAEAQARVAGLPPFAAVLADLHAAQATVE